MAKVGVTLPSGEEAVGESGGDGPIDAVFRAIQEATGTESELRQYTVDAVTGGEDALGEVTVMLRTNGAWRPASASPPTSSRPRPAPTCEPCPTRLEGAATREAEAATAEAAVERTRPVAPGTDPRRGDASPHPTLRAPRARMHGTPAPGPCPDHPQLHGRYASLKCRRSPLGRGDRGARGRQHGVVGREQLLALGLGGTRSTGGCRPGRLHRLHAGRLRGRHTAITREGRWMAAVLASGTGAVLSHRSAAALWGIRGYSERAESHVTVTAEEPLATRDPPPLAVPFPPTR